MKEVSDAKIYIIVILFLILSIFLYFHFNKVTIKDVRSQLETNIAPQSDRSDVIEYLDRMNIENSGHINIPGDNTIYAIIRFTSYGFLSHADIQIRFIFDQENKLVKYEIGKIITGL